MRINCWLKHISIDLRFVLRLQCPHLYAFGHSGSHGCTQSSGFRHCWTHYRKTGRQNYICSFVLTMVEAWNNRVFFPLHCASYRNFIHTHRNPKNVSLQLHQQIIHCHPTVDLKRCQRDATVHVHCIQKLRFAQKDH